MAYEVELSRRALQDSVEAVSYISQDSESAAARWFEQLEAALRSLIDMPRRCPRVPEAAQLKLEYRQLLHYSHRIIFRIDDTSNRVLVARINHAARRPLRSPGGLADG